jgi:hypothetical protein
MEFHRDRLQNWYLNVPSQIYPKELQKQKI